MGPLFFLLSDWFVNSTHTHTLFVDQVAKCNPRFIRGEKTDRQDKTRQDKTGTKTGIQAKHVRWTNERTANTRCPESHYRNESSSTCWMLYLVKDDITSEPIKRVISVSTSNATHRKYPSLAQSPARKCICLVLSYLVLPCLALSCLALSCLVLSCLSGFASDLLREREVEVKANPIIAPERDIVCGGCHRS